MKKVIIMAALVLLTFGLVACSNSGSTSSSSSSQTSSTNSSQKTQTSSSSTGQSSQTSSSSAASGSTAATSNSNQASGSTLVVYFSATGTTKGVGDRIAAMTGADVYEIKAAQPYSQEDLNWNDSNSRSTREQNDQAVRPEIGSETISLDKYKTIYIGYPIWWGEEPRILDTFVEKYNFNGITVIPFCTSSSSGIGRSGKNLADNAKSGTWKDGARLNSNASESEIRSLIAQSA